MGKSTAGDLLLAEGFCLVDTDTIARDVVRPGEPALGEIVQTFGTHLVSSSGELRRDELARIVFGDDSARQALEAILHPRIRNAWQLEVGKWRAENQPFGFVVIPLLFETAASHSFDATICVSCSKQTQLQRLRKRNWDDAHLQRRIEAQWPVEKKIAASDYVVWTDTEIEVHKAQLDRIIATVR